MDGRAHLFQTGGEGGPGLVQGGGGAVAVNGAKRTICQLVDISIQVPQQLECLWKHLPILA